MQLLKYIGKRLLFMIVTLMIVIIATFFLMQIMPGTPFNNPKIAGNPQLLHTLEQAYGLNLPIWEQLLRYIGNFFTGNWGYSFAQGQQPVIDIVAQRLPVSAQLGLEALLFAIVFGVILGGIAARFQNKLLDNIISVLTTFMYSVPSFVFAYLILFFIGYTLNLLPYSGWTGMFTPESIMPATALGLGVTAQIASFVRAQMIEALHSDYILLARAKGLSSREVLFKHALRNSLIPMLTLIGPVSAGLLTGSVLIETIFSIPGIGAQFVNSIPSKDYPVIMATTIVYAAMLMGMILLTDIITAIVDPRVRLD
ncbi:MAG: ABC transporter permease [Streptococcaceae bacterium]|jgi:oligopeptide transport system permease protein|nr:ABC transporter permease [Streptococcaceae bacterium]